MTQTGPRVVALVTLLCASAAHAHGLDANRVQLVLRGDVAEVVATVPVEFLRDVDLDRDGRLTLGELDPRRGEVRGRLSRGLSLTDDRGRAGAVVRADVSLPRDADPARGSDFVRFTVLLRWPAAPAALSLRCAFVGEHPVSVFASRAAPAGPGSLALVGPPELRVAESPSVALTLLRAARPPAPPPRGRAVAFALSLAFVVALAARRRRLLPPADGAPT